MYISTGSSKAALDMLTKVMGLELGPHNVSQQCIHTISPPLLPLLQIRVNAVNPTVVFTEMGRKAWSDSQKSAPMLQRIPLGKFAGTRERERGGKGQK